MLPAMKEDIVAHIAAERAGILAFLAGTGEADWGRPTACAPWTLKDVLAHMIEGELNVGLVYRRELREAGYLDPNDGIAKWNVLPGEAVRASFWQHGVATQRALDQMTDEIYRSPIRVFGCRQVSQLVRVHLFDLAVHGHDLADALGVAPAWTPRLSFLVEFVVRAAPLTLRRLRVEPAGALGVRDGERTWVIDGRGDGWTLGDAEPDAWVEADAEDLVLATTGRRDVDEVLARATITGDREIAERILRSWRVLAQ